MERGEEVGGEEVVEGGREVVGGREEVEGVGERREEEKRRTRCISDLCFLSTMPRHTLFLLLQKTNK